MNICTYMTHIYMHVYICICLLNSEYGLEFASFEVSFVVCILLMFTPTRFAVAM